MCTRFIYNGTDLITGFNFEIDLAVWQHTIVQDQDCWGIGIQMPDGLPHLFHGVNQNGNVGTLLYVPGNLAGQYIAGAHCHTISDLTEQFIHNQLTFEEAVQLVQTKKITYAPDATMQAFLSDQYGRTLIIEPGVGYRQERKRYSLLTNDSLLDPIHTAPYHLPGDNRYERTEELLAQSDQNFTVTDAFAVLQAVHQEGIWATRVTFVYSHQAQKVYYVLNNTFGQIQEYSFSD